VGRFERVLEAAAVARSLVAVWPAHPGAPGFDTPRLALGCLGITNWVLDLRPGPHGYHARLLETAAAALEMAEQVGELAGWTPESPAGDAGEATRLRASVSDADPEWSRIAAQLRRGIASVRIEAASISQPTGPLLQHRLTVVSADDDDWVLLGIREGERGARRAAPATALPMGPILEDLLGGREIR
jgi:hypothetical protein